MDLNSPRWTAVTGSDYQVAARTIGGDWTLVRDGDSGRPFWVRFQLVQQRPRVMGLKLDDGAPVTARQLREPRIADLEGAFGAFLMQSMDEIDMVQEAVTGASIDSEELTDSLVVLDSMRSEVEAWLSALTAADHVAVAPRGRGSAPPSDDELRGFARVLLAQQLRGARGSVTRTAKEIGIDRSTVYRWIKTCKKRGLLPSQTEENS